MLRGHEGRVLSAVFSPDGARVLTASSDSTAIIRPVETLDDLISRARARTERANALTDREQCESFPPDGSMLSFDKLRECGGCA